MLFAALAGAVLMSALAMGSQRVRRGRWEAHRPGTGLVWFESDVGRIAFDHGGQLRVAPLAGNELTFALTDVSAIRFSYAEHESLEVLAQYDIGFNYRSGRADVLELYSVALVTRGGDVPVFEAGHAHAHLIGARWLTTVVEGMLDRLRMLPDVEAHARGVVVELQGEFAGRGHPVGLA